MDPFIILLSGRDYRRADPDHGGESEGMSLYRYADPAFRRCDLKSDGTPNESGTDPGCGFQIAEGDAGYYDPDDTDHGLSG